MALVSVGIKPAGIGFGNAGCEEGEIWLVKSRSLRYKAPDGGSLINYEPPNGIAKTESLDDAFSRYPGAGGVRLTQGEVSNSKRSRPTGEEVADQLVAELDASHLPPSFAQPPTK